ncbi:MAG: UvrD-helicase domain-containing protein [Planctomycetes bacterium]|nr:UvrD-helicase domain-containing protein [Planctomycetota bacterium]MBL7042647.1 UvrD-helicase domain-containing protein [Pirellulaceae bacterium]
MNQPHGSRSLPNLLIRASAGTGKTFRLSSRFLELLRDGVPSDHILATTFTRKAAGEILDRVVGRLAEATQSDEKRELLERYSGGESLSRDECLRLLETAMRNLHRLRVSTLDSFFSQIARSFGLELGLPPGWEIVDELNDSRLRSEAIDAVLGRDDVSELRALMSLLTMGEATRGVSQLVRDAVDGLYDVFLETDEDAWQKVPRFKPLDEVELAEALDDLREVDLPEGSLSKARDADYGRAIEANWKTFLGTGLTKKISAGETVFSRKTIPLEAVAIYERLIEHVKAETVGRVALQTEATYKLLKKFHVEYQRLKQSYRATRFTDITRRVSDIRHLVDGRQLAFRLDSRIDHVLLDEFQDTSPSQWRVIRPLAERVSLESADTSFFCVGDVKQAIYGWRGGVAEIFDAIDQQLDGLQAEQLNVSRRSSQPVIDAVNRIFNGIAGHPNLGRAENAVRRWCDGFEEHETAMGKLAGFVELQTAPLAGEGQKQAEATIEFAAEKIAQIVQHAQGYSVGVLVRKNATVGRLIYELRARGIPASEEGGNPLTDSAAVTVVLSLLRLADHPADTVARFHLAHSPLGPVIGLTDYEDDAAARCVAQSVRRSLAQDGYGPAICGWAEELSDNCSRRELSRLEQLVEMAYAYQASATLRTDDFVAYVENTRVSDPVPVDVRVMTIHQAKGLEFDIVVLPELDAGLVGQPNPFVIERPDLTGPIQRVCRYASMDIQQLMPADIRQMFSQATDREVTESLCVMYVAITRAVHALHMIIPPSTPNERTLPRTFAGLLRTALKGDRPVDANAVLFEHGDSRWFDQSGRDEREKTVARDAADDRAPVTVRLAELTGQRRRGWDRARPSGLEGGSRVHLNHVFAADRSGAFLRGELIHAWFEQIEWLDDGRPDQATLRRVADDVLARAGGASIDVDGQIVRFNTMLDSPTIAQTLVHDRYLDLANLGFPSEIAAKLAKCPFEPVAQNERGFAIYEGGQLLSGFVDRLVLLNRGNETIAAEVIDYKTDAVDVDDAEQLTDKVAFYAPQLDAYRRAVAKVAQLSPERVAARLLFVGGGVLRTVPWPS